MVFVMVRLAFNVNVPFAGLRRCQVLGCSATNADAQLDPGDSHNRPQAVCHIAIEICHGRRSVKVLALRERLGFVERFVTHRASIPQWLGLKKQGLGFLGGWRLMWLGKLWL